MSTYLLALLSASLAVHTTRQGHETIQSVGAQKRIPELNAAEIGPKSSFTLSNFCYRFLEKMDMAAIPDSAGNGELGFDNLQRSAVLAFPTLKINEGHGGFMSWHTCGSATWFHEVVGRPVLNEGSPLRGVPRRVTVNPEMKNTWTSFVR